MPAGSAGASPALAQPRPAADEQSAFLTLATARLIAREIAFFVETDFEEDQQQPPRETRRHQHDREDFARYASDQGGTRAAGENQRGGRAKREDARSRSHASYGIQGQ
jgi:hypothetical protein